MRIHLRPHHIMCISNFVGYGYSDEFVVNMREVISHLKKGAEIAFQKHCDDLCEKCPHKIDGFCESEDKIISLDLNTASKFSIDYDKLYSFEQLSEQYFKLIKTQEDLLSICGECSWIEICKENLKAMRNA